MTLVSFRYLEQWRTFMHDGITHNLYTINMHMLRHVADAIKVLGVPRAISTRRIERAIGTTCLLL